VNMGATVAQFGEIYHAIMLRVSGAESFAHAPL